MTYNRDLQEDKERLFDSVDTIRSTVRIMAALLGNVSVNVETCNAAAWVPCNSVQWFTPYIPCSSMQHSWSSSPCNAVQLMHGGPCTSRSVVRVAVR